ncbi:putative 3-hydroxyisobutyrate dehydrogenase [Pholiota conissans]|uniref:3-hydroxyisobutyrate dehydrogenase n=1 Tax=Pholiota conissans TaxID=109636 RepID=A0A9P5Z0T2_9AGAR|nr:putative 3-hydroxyisobutyrate dehydrogenase [Pholiota conissans]
MNSEDVTQPDFPKTFGWIGLGAMGFPMALQLRAKVPAESVLYIYDIDAGVLENFLKETAGNAGMGEYVVIAKDAREVTERSECIITIVPEGAHVRAVFQTPETGILAAPDISGKIFIDCSTIDIATSLSINAAVQSTHASSPTHTNPPPQFFDAPVSGGTAGASKGTLTIMLGCAQDSHSLPLLTRILRTMGTNVYALGGPSLGLAAKLSNNYLSGMIALATSEAMNLGMRLGVDPRVLQRCFSTSSGGSWVNDTVNPVPGVCPDAVTSKGYKGGFKVQLMKKDMGLAIAAAKEVGAKLVLGDAGLAAYAAASEDPRCRDRDSRVVYRWLGGSEPELANSTNND